MFLENHLLMTEEINKAIDIIIHNSKDLLQGSYTNFMNNLNGDVDGI